MVQQIDPSDDELRERLRKMDDPALLRCINCDGFMTQRIVDFFAVSTMRRAMVAQFQTQSAIHPCGRLEILVVLNLLRLTGLDRERVNTRPLH